MTIRAIIAAIGGPTATERKMRLWSQLPDSPIDYEPPALRTVARWYAGEAAPSLAHAAVLSIVGEQAGQGVAAQLLYEAALQHLHFEAL